MALDKQVVPINLGLGIDTKTDPKHVVPGRLAALENAIFTKTNQLAKRNGFDMIDNKTAAGTELSGSGDAVAIFNDELLQYNNQTLYSYNSSIDKWVDKGASVSAIVKTRAIIKNTYQQSQCDSAFVNGIGVYAWEDGRGGIRATVVDETTGNSLLADTSIHATATRVRCVAFSNYLYVYYYVSGSLWVRRLNPLLPTAFEAAVELSTTVNTTNPTYDIYAYRNLRVCFAHNVQGSTAIKAGWHSETPAVLTGSLGTVTIAEAGTNSIGIVEGPSSTFYIMYQNGTNGVRCTIRNISLTELYAPFTVENITASNVVNITGYKTTTTGIKCFYQVSAASTYNTVVRTNTITTAGVAGTAADFLRSVGLASKAFTYTDTDDNVSAFVGLVHESTLQATFFIARGSDGVIVGKQQYTTAGGLTTRPILANVTETSTGVFTWALIKKHRLVSDNATLFTLKGVAKTTVDFTSGDIFTARQLGKNLHIVGGVLSMYDGQSVVEHGFHLYPENLTVTPSTTGGSLADGAYSVVVLYEWTDNFGQIHRSAPSVASTATVSGGGGSGSIAVTAPTLRLTSKNGVGRTHVSVVGYVTELNGSVHYRFTSVSSPTYNTLASDTVSLGTITTVASISSNEILYTTGGVLANYAPPACASISVFKNRIWLSDLEESDNVMYSQEHVDGQPVEFNDELVKAGDRQGGTTKAMEKLDDKILLFKKDSFYYSYGDGPNRAGQLGDFAEPQFRSADVGCDNQRSLVAFPGGLMFKSEKGIYALDGSLTPYYVGADVEDYNDEEITSAVVVNDLNQVRFTTESGALLVYDYTAKQWTTFGRMDAKSAVVWQNQYVIMRYTDQDILVENLTKYRDGKAPYCMAIETGWISPASIAGYQRIYRLMLVGEYKSPHKMRVKIAFDMSPAYTQEVVFDPADLLDVNTYGDDDATDDDSDGTYGSLSTYGGVSNAYRFTLKLKKQKCQAIKIRIEEVTYSATAGSHEAFTLSAIGMLLGLKKGFGKVRTAQAVAMGS